MQTRSLKSERSSRGSFGATVTMLLAVALLNFDTASGRPDVRQSPFSLELQPPLVGAAAEEAFRGGGKRAVDSYGNPIDSLRPIDTPDGRKVVSAQGLQFEIPNYASGITEIRKPADDLLPPHIVRVNTPAGGQAAAQIPTQPSRGASEDQFPPFTGSTTDGQKVEYTKSDEGKVISTPVYTQRKDAPGSSGFQGTSSIPPPASNTDKYTGGFGAPPGLLRPQSASKPDIYVAGEGHEFRTKPSTVNPTKVLPGGRYTGGFNAPSGVLTPNNAPRPFQQAQQPNAQGNQHALQPAQSRVQSHVASAASGHQQSRFGGPPGILVPFDNQPRAAHQ